MNKTIYNFELKQHKNKIIVLQLKYVSALIVLHVLWISIYYEIRTRVYKRHTSSLRNTTRSHIERVRFRHTYIIRKLSSAFYSS